MAGPWTEFGEVAAAHLLAVSVPGSDFAIVLKQSLAHGRRAGIWTALGVGAAISLHVAYSLLGIGLLLRGSPLAFAIVKYSGAAYLAWIGVQGLRAKARTADVAAAPDPSHRPSARAAFTAGFFTNALNPKVTFFMVALFVTIVSPATPKWIQAGYGLWIIAMTAAWFSVVACVFTQARVRAAFLRRGHWIDRALGVVFLAFALSLALASLR